MNPPGAKSHPILKTFLWLFIVVFVCSIGFVLVSSNSGAPHAQSKIRMSHPGGHNNPTQSDPTSLATITAGISAVGALSTMVLSWAQFIRDRKKSGTSSLHSSLADIVDEQGTTVGEIRRFHVLTGCL